MYSTAWTIINTSSHGAIILQDDDDKYFKVNGHRLKNFHEPFHSSKVIHEINLVDFASFPGKIAHAPIFHLAQNPERPHEKQEAQTSPGGFGRAHGFGQAQVGTQVYLSLKLSFRAEPHYPKVSLSLIFFGVI